jgi:hypothetical protein
VYSVWLHATLGFDLATDNKPNNVTVDISNIAHLEKLLDRNLDPAQIHQAAQDESYRG